MGAAKAGLATVLSSLLCLGLVHRADAAPPSSPPSASAAPSAAPGQPGAPMTATEPAEPNGTPPAGPSAPATGPSGSTGDPSAARETEPAAAPPTPARRAQPPEEDPLAVPEAVREHLGSNDLRDARPPGPRVRSGLYPLVYRETSRRERTDVGFPLYVERRSFDERGKLERRETLIGPYYRLRSSTQEHVDALFPLYVHWGDAKTHTTIIPPVLYRNGPAGWHTWVAPLFFASDGKEGGYVHIPPLLTFSRHRAEGAFSLIGGLGFYDRTGRDVDWGVAPFVFGGHNDDKLTSYFLIPPLLTYHYRNRDTDVTSTLVGPVFRRSSPKSSRFDVYPIFFHGEGVEEGERYTSTTLLPAFHYTRNAERSLLITPLFLNRNANDGNTFVSWLYSRHRGRTTFDAVGPVVPLFAHYRDPDVNSNWWLVGPLYTSNAPTGWSVRSPLFSYAREYGVGNTLWIFPTIHYETQPNSWLFNIYPLIFNGADATSSHSVVAPLWWNFLSAKRRVTVLVPGYVRVRDEGGLTTVALNSLWMERKSRGTKSWDYYFLPLFHVGDSPQGSSWDVLFGLVGYKREGAKKQLSLFWIPFGI